MIDSEFEKLYKLYLTPVYRYCYLRLGNKESAEDVAHTVFEKVYTAKNSFRDQGKSPLTYLFTIARNTIIDRSRKTELVAVDPQSASFQQLEDLDNSPTASVLQREASQAVYKALQSLSEESREVVVLRYISELSYEEIASFLNKSQEAVRQTVSRGLKELREKIKYD